MSRSAGVRQHQPRLVEGADEVLALRRVDPGLAADRAVDLGEERRRKLHEADAPAQDRGGEAGEITDHPAAEGHHQVVAADLLGDQPLHRALEAGPALRRLPRRQLQDRRLDPGFGQPRPERRQVQRGHPRLGQDRHTRAAQQGRHLRSRPRQKARADADVVGAIAERHGDGLDHSEGSSVGPRPVPARS